LAVPALTISMREQRGMLTKDRQRGSLLGLAIGDALGAAVEFEPAGSFPEVVGYRDGGPHGLEPGEWTDDTSLALALADSIAEHGWDLQDQAERYLSWWRTGAYSVNGRVFDIGIATCRALQRFRETGDPRRSGDPSPQASGNGSLMRLGPVPVAYARLFPDRLELLVERLVESSLPTHASPQCLSSCAYFGLVLCGLLHGRPREEVLAPDWEPLRWLEGRFPLHPEVLEVARGSFRRKQPPEIRGSGYVVRCLEAALWAFHDAADFRRAVLRAVNLGDDADTTGAVCGQVSGACWGESAIPREWRDGLAGRDQIEEILRRLIG
jgi:ADP-ribosyl-[dinitrogen reductase] hydrolase